MLRHPFSYQSHVARPSLLYALVWYTATIDANWCKHLRIYVMQRSEINGP